MFVQKLPAIGLDNAVDPADRVSAIDFIHRVNRLFDAWDIDAMVEAFLPDSVTHHTHGISRGKVETRRFFQEQSPYLVPGVSRQALSLVVDPDDDDGVIVRYHNLLVRQTQQTASPRIVSGQVVTGPADIPQLWIYSAMTDRPRRTENGWRILERRVGPTSMSNPYVAQEAAW